jgi:hypothetical protein
MSPILYIERRQSYFVVVLQNSEVFVEGETGSSNETDVECDVDGTEECSIEAEDALDIKEEVSIEVEDAIDIKDETPEAIIFQTIKTEQEVMLCGVCVCVSWWQLQLLAHLLPQKENFEITPNWFLLCVMFCVPYSFKIWVAMLKGKDLLQLVAINGRIILKCIL